MKTKFGNCNKFGFRAWHDCLKYLVAMSLSYKQPGHDVKYGHGKGGKVIYTSQCAV